MLVGCVRASSHTSDRTRRARLHSAIAESFKPSTQQGPLPPLAPQAPQPQHASTQHPGRTCVTLQDSIIVAAKGLLMASRSSWLGRPGGEKAAAGAVRDLHLLHSRAQAGSFPLPCFWIIHTRALHDSIELAVSWRPQPSPVCCRHSPVHSMMRSSWFMVELPGKMGLPLSISPRMQPGETKCVED